LYKLVRPLLFRLDAEASHNLTFGLLARLYRLPGAGVPARMLYARRTPALPVEVMGLRFPNPVGLGGGLDKNARTIQPLADLGFGFLELGTVTPRPQPGNPKKRMFRLIEHGALINRMGFNNDGVAALVENVRRQGHPVPLGINIGKNFDTPLEKAVDDYIAALRAVYGSADYVAVNISSPNTAQLRELQGRDPLNQLLAALKAEQARLRAETGRLVPLAVKIAPDLDDAQIEAIAELLLHHGIDAVIATNTTVTRPSLSGVPGASEAGGLSGRPLKSASTAVIGKLYQRLQGRVPIIGVGGISTAADAWEKLVAGADAVQIYTALIYEGPGVVRTIVRGLAAHVRATGEPDIKHAVLAARRNLSSEKPYQVQKIS
jgi:dihydroorotate dehydrogenase